MRILSSAENCRRVRYPASEKLEIIRLVEESALAVQIVPAVEGGARNANLFQRPPHATDVLHDLCRRFFLRHGFLSHLRSLRRLR
jgi:hypothetical protein